ncbi:hypothetical protein [Nocardioides sp. Root151]|uniref:hypothetical protein n=1 Tax=Nocardioides sp. Root151 TaxID=1736475 RepID=UPI000703AD9F|nr:hypothetical protein [Nocardioides sp. Root151]KQZ76134.1 hypothetical protein ASD66_07625 [Nocardioides sp. Root151]
MTQMPQQHDPTYQALNQLVAAGQLSPDQAQAALDATRAGGGRAPFFANSLVPVWLRPDVLLVVFGTALLSAAVAVSTVWTREDGDIDWSNYLVGIGATVVLLAGAAAGWFLVQDPARKANLMSWPGALGAIGVGQMIGVGLDDNDFAVYGVGAVIVALCAGGYYLIRQPAFVVAAIVGIFLLYVQVFDDTYGVDDIDGDNFGIALGLVVLVFTLMITVAGWFLPTRDLTALIVGAFAVGAYAVTLVALVAIAAVSMAFSGFDEMDGGEPKQPDNPYTNDVWFLLVFGAILTLVWAAAWWLRGHDGYRVLILAMLTSILPAATFALAVEHPTWWGVVLAALGAIGLALAVGRALGMLPNNRQAPTRPPV